MSKEIKEKDYQNDWAFNQDFTKYLHITTASKGLNGYYCLGCKKEMQAVKGKIKAHHFRHHANNVDKHKTECVVASKKYRELLAKDILHRLKLLKLPYVFKYPPTGIDGAPNLLQDPITVKADFVKSELTFFEDENSLIKFGVDPDVDESLVLIKPSITFFDKNFKPILLIDFVDNHKIDDIKRNKLKHLGINTVQIIIPKKPESEIEEALKSRTKIKWVYNEIESETAYIHLSKPHNNRVWEIDNEQRELFEESYKCRASQIKYLIRSIRRGLESQSYKRTEQHLEQEISRIERATKAERQGLGDMEARTEGEVREELAGRLKSFEKEKVRFEKDYTDLESRYLKKRSEIEEAERIELNRFEIEDIFRDTEDGIRGDFDYRRERIKADFKLRREEIERQSREIEGRTRNLSIDLKQLPNKSRRIKAEEEAKLDSRIEKLKSEQSTIESKIENFGEYAIKEERRFVLEFEKYRKQSIETINNRDSQGDSRLSKRIKAILDVGRITTNYNERLKTYKRYKAYLELARGGTWKR